MASPSNIKSQKQLIGMLFYYSKFIKIFSDKIQPVNHNEKFLLIPFVLYSFQTLKNNLKDATLVTVNPDKEFEMETDARHYCIASTLNQKGGLAAFFSHTLNPNEIKHYAIEKEAAAIIEVALLPTWQTLKS